MCKEQRGEREGQGRERDWERAREPQPDPVPLAPSGIYAISAPVVLEITSGSRHQHQAVH